MALVRHDDARLAETALEQLAAMLRYVLRSERAESGAEFADNVRFADEWRFVENYLALERLRLGDRLRLEIAIEPRVYDCELPAFTVQPLVENSIKHAIAPRAAGGTIWISARIENQSKTANSLRIEIRDDAGAPLESIENSGGIGLRTVKQRLEAAYGAAANCSIVTQPNKGFAVIISLPVEPKTLS